MPYEDPEHRHHHGSEPDFSGINDRRIREGIPTRDLASMRTRTIDDPEKIAVINGMQDPVHLVAPAVSMKYLYTDFLSKILCACGQEERGMPRLDDDVAAFFDEQDAQHGLTLGVDGWYSFFVDRTAYSGCSNGIIEDLAENYPQSDNGKAARIINPIQYAILLATEIVQTYLEREDNVFLDRYARTLLGSMGGKIVTDGEKALVESWGDAIGACEAPVLGMFSSKSETGGLVFRPAVSTIS